MMQLSKNSDLRVGPSPWAITARTNMESFDPYQLSAIADEKEFYPPETGIFHQEPPLDWRDGNNGFSDQNGKNSATGNLPPEESPDPEPQRGFLPVLKNRNFLALWSGQVFSQLADKIYLVLTIALIDTYFQAADQPISSWVSAIMIASTIPAILFGAAAGVFVDRWLKKVVLVSTNLLRGGLVLLIPLVIWLTQGKSLGHIPLGFQLLLLITFLISTLTQFFAPAEQATIPLIVERRHLLSANSLYTTTMMGSVIIGFAVGEPLLAASDSLIGRIYPGLSIGKELMVGGSYIIAGLILLLMKTKEKLEEVDHNSPHPLEDLRDGLRYLKGHHPVRNAMIQLVILFSIFAALAVLAVRLAEILPGMKPSQFGFLLAAAGVGMGAGATIVGQLGHKMSHAQLSLIGSFGIASSLFCLSLFTHNLWATILLITLVGVFGAVVGVPMQTTIQAETPEDMRGKVFGLQNNAINIALSLPLVLAGVAETFFGLSVVFLGLAGLSIGGGILTWYISRIDSKIKTQ
jgi:predicted MFS family arabinose efflux permease